MYIPIELLKLKDVVEELEAAADAFEHVAHTVETIAANAIATAVSTRALTPRTALLLAAVMNFVGAFLGQKVARTVSEILQIGGGCTAWS